MPTVSCYCLFTNCILLLSIYQLYLVTVYLPTVSCYCLFTNCILLLSIYLLYLVTVYLPTVSCYCLFTYAAGGSVSVTSDGSKGHPATGRGGPRGSGSVKAQDFLDVRHYIGGRSSAIRTGCLYPRRNFWYSF